VSVDKLEADHTQTVCIKSTKGTFQDTEGTTSTSESIKKKVISHGNAKQLRKAP
jgi:hypothetical protein